MDSTQTMIDAREWPPPGRRDARREPFRSRSPGDGVGRPPEQRLLGRYLLLERLGAGGFGVVWRAHDELLQREVAVKRIWLGAGEGSDRAERAAREAHATARLSHPAIVALYEAYSQGEAFYLISELVDGQTLGALIAAGALTDERIAAIGISLTDALEHAHARGVIHRDIKPQNVLVPATSPAAGHWPRAAAKLTDFGGASIAEEDALTRTGDVLGTLAYMAPEQSEGRDVGEEADVYALGLLLYEALSGVNPVRGGTAAATARRIGTRLESLARRRRDLPRGLIETIDRAIRPAPGERADLEQLRDALSDSLPEEAGREGDTRPQPTYPRPPVTRRRRPTPHAAASVRDELAIEEADEHGRAEAPERATAGLPRFVLGGLTIAATAWEAAAGRPGLGLLVLIALAPLALIPGERRGRVPGVWFAALLAPLLGLAGLAGAFPAAAGQAARWRRRLVLGALGYWWLSLAGPLLGKRLWLAPPASALPRSAWESSPGAAISHVLAPMLGLGLLLGVLLWALAALVLPWLVRGRRAALDVFACTLYSALLLSLGPSLYAGAAGADPSPRGAVLGAVLGGLLAVGARALRGPV